MDWDRVGIKAILINKIGELVYPVGKILDFAAAQSLGVIQKGPNAVGQGIGPITPNQIQKFPLSAQAGGALGFQIASVHAGKAHVAFQSLDERLVEMTGVV